MFRRKSGWILLLVLAIACPVLSWAAATSTAPPKSATTGKGDSTPVNIYCCLPIPAYPGRWGINDATIKGQIVPLVRKVAKDTESDVIDLYTPMIGRGACVPDSVHPNGDGHAVMAKALFKALTGKDMPETAKDTGK